MLGRWNLAFALAEGRVRGVERDLGHFVPSGVAAVGALTDAVGTALLHTPLPAPARAALVDYMSDGQGDQATLDQPALDRKLPELVGLILASPAFQIH
jgi:hypothetical protein